MAKEMGAIDLEGRSDSQLVTSQVFGEFKAKDFQLAIYLHKVRGLIFVFSDFKLVHVPREQNAWADLPPKLATTKKPSNNHSGDYPKTKLWGAEGIVYTRGVWFMDGPDHSLHWGWSSSRWPSWGKQADERGCEVHGRCRDAIQEGFLCPSPPMLRTRTSWLCSQGSTRGCLWNSHRRPSFSI